LKSLEVEIAPHALDTCKFPDLCLSKVPAQGTWASVSKAWKTQSTFKNQ